MIALILYITGNTKARDTLHQIYTWSNSFAVFTAATLTQVQTKFSAQEVAKRESLQLVNILPFSTVSALYVQYD